MERGAFPQNIDVKKRRNVNPEFACAVLFYLVLLAQIIMSFVIFASKNSEVMITDSDGIQRCPAGLFAAPGCQASRNSLNYRTLENGWGICVDEALCADIATMTGGGTRRLSVQDLDMKAFEDDLRSGDFYRRLAEETGPTSRSRLRQRDAARRRLQGFNVQPVDGLWDFLETFFYQPIVLLGSACVLSVLWLIFLQNAAKAAIWGTMVLDGALLVATIVWYAIDLEVVNWPAIVFLVCLVIGCIVMRKQINNCAVVMKKAMDGLSMNKRIFAVCAGVQVVWILYFSLFLASIVGMHFVKEVAIASDPYGYGSTGNSVRLEMKGWLNNQGVHALWCVCYYWATFFFLNTNLMLITANLTGWYFEQENYKSFWVSALPWCVFQQAGGNAIASAIMGLAEYIIGLRGGAFNLIFAITVPWNWILLCVGACLQQFLEAFTQFGVISMTFSGESFCGSAQAGLALIKDRVGSCVLTNFLGKNVMGWACYMISLAVGFAGWAWADDLQGYGSLLSAIEIQYMIIVVLMFARIISYPFVTLLIVVLLESFLSGLGSGGEWHARITSILCAMFLSSLTMFILNAVSHIVVSAMNVIFFCYAVESQNGGKQERFSELYDSIKASVTPGGVQGDSSVVSGRPVAGSPPPQSSATTPAEQQNVVGNAVESNSVP